MCHVASTCTPSPKKMLSSRSGVSGPVVALVVVVAATSMLALRTLLEIEVAVPALARWYAYGASCGFCAAFLPVEAAVHLDSTKRSAAVAI